MSAGALGRALAYRLTSPLAIGLALGAAACQRTNDTERREPGGAEETAESLAANPARLDAVQAGCRANEPWATEALCAAAAEAIRQRFQGKGVPYTPGRIEPYPSRPESATPSAGPAR